MDAGLDTDDWLLSLVKKAARRGAAQALAGCQAPLHFGKCDPRALRAEHRESAAECARAGGAHICCDASLARGTRLMRDQPQEASVNAVLATYLGAAHGCGCAHFRYSAFPSEAFDTPNGAFPRL